MSKIIRLPQDSCPTGCKWTPKSRLKTTCQIPPPPEESFNTAAEVSWVTKILCWKRVMKVNFGHMWGRFSFFFFPKTKIKKCAIWFSQCDAVKKLSITSCVLFPQLWVNFDTAVHSGSWSTSLPESLEARANWRERAWPLTSAHWLIAATVCPTVSVCECVCVSLYTILLYTILFPTLHPSHRKCVVFQKWSCILAHTLANSAVTKMHE